MKRWNEHRPARGGTNLEDRAAELFRRVPEPPPLSDLQLQRVGRRIASRARTRHLGWWTLAAALCALCVLLGVRLVRRAPPSAPPAALRIVPLGQNWLVLRSSASPASIDLLGVRLELSARAMVEVDLRLGLRSGRVQLASYSGSVRADTLDGVIRLDSGQAWVNGQLTAIDPSRQKEATAALDGVVQSPAVLPEPPLPRRAAAKLNEPRRDRVAPLLTNGDELDEPMPNPGERPAETKPESALAGESRLLGNAVRSLRREHDAAGALVTLDQYRAQFPHGTLSHEEEQLRVDALLQLDRRAEALALLGRAPLGEMARSVELLVVRGELRAQAGQCGDAVGDFSSALAHADGELKGRALFGRAGCRMGRGELDGARADLREYLRQYPSGVFAGEARRVLEGNL